MMEEVRRESACGEYLHCVECQKKIKLAESHKCVTLRCMDCGGLFCPVCEGVGERYDVADVLVMVPHQCGVCLKRTDDRGGGRHAVV